MGETDCARKTISLFSVWRKSSLGTLLDFGADTLFLSRANSLQGENPERVCSALVEIITRRNPI
jgi:hypothetical protein